MENGGAIESTGPAPEAGQAPEAGAAATRQRRATAAGWVDRALDKLVLDRTIVGLLCAWLGVVVGFGAAYWAAGAAGLGWLVDSAGIVGGGIDGLGTAIYFSFVTALSIGYGDVSPLGAARMFAVIEGAAGLLIFGLVISKLVSRRQEALVEDTHRISFEQRLGRVRTNLHLVVSELQRIATMCADPTVPDESVRIRIESTVAIFEGELKTIHDLLYRPEHVPDEQALEAILAGLVAALEVLRELLACLPDRGARSTFLRNSLRQVNSSAMEICADCVPRDYAPHLSAWMDRVRGLAEQIS